MRYRGGKGKSKPAKENGDEEKHSSFSSSPFSFAGLDFPLPPRSVPGSPRMR